MLFKIIVATLLVVPTASGSYFTTIYQSLTMRHVQKIVYHVTPQSLQKAPWYVQPSLYFKNPWLKPAMNVYDTTLPVINLRGFTRTMILAYCSGRMLQNSTTCRGAYVTLAALWNVVLPLYGAYRINPLIETAAYHNFNELCSTAVNGLYIWTLDTLAKKMHLVGSDHSVFSPRNYQELHEHLSKNQVPGVSKNTILNCVKLIDFRTRQDIRTHGNYWNTILGKIYADPIIKRLAHRYIDQYLKVYQYQQLNGPHENHLVDLNHCLQEIIIAKNIPQALQPMSHNRSMNNLLDRVDNVRLQLCNQANSHAEKLSEYEVSNAIIKHENDLNNDQIIYNLMFHCIKANDRYSHYVHLPNFPDHTQKTPLHVKIVARCAKISSWKEYKEFIDEIRAVRSLYNNNKILFQLHAETHRKSTALCRLFSYYAGQCERTSRELPKECAQQIGTKFLMKNFNHTNTQPRRTA